MDTAATNEKIKALRETSVREVCFSKVLVGGYQPKEVDEYIEDLQANAEQTQLTFREKLEEYASECSILSHERETLQKQISELEADMVRMRDTAAEQQEAAQALAQENTRLNELVLQMQRERGASRAAVSKSGTPSRALTEEDNRLLIENKALRKTILEQNAQIKAAKSEHASKDKQIRELSLAKRALAMDTNMNLYHYRLNVESGIKRAKQSVEDLSGILELLQNQSDSMYDKAKTVLE